MFYPNKKWRDETVFTTDPIGKPLEPVVKPELQLTGFDGNAFYILGKAQKVAKKAGWDKEKIDKFLKEAKSKNYDHLLATCIKYFDVI